MDSRVDAPIIVTEKFADQCAGAIVKVLVERGKLKKKPDDSGKTYRVQVGAFSNPKNAEDMLKKVKAAGFADAFIKTD